MLRYFGCTTTELNVLEALGEGFFFVKYLHDLEGNTLKRMS